jgi:hypothetical protein
MTTQTIITLAEAQQADPRTWFESDGKRFKLAAVYIDTAGEISVTLSRMTKQGKRYQNGEGMWLTMANSLDRFPVYADLAALVREIVAAAAEVPQIERELAQCAEAKGHREGSGHTSTQCPHLNRSHPNCEHKPGMIRTYNGRHFCGVCMVAMAPAGDGTYVLEIFAKENAR